MASMDITRLPAATRAADLFTKGRQVAGEAGARRAVPCGTAWRMAAKDGGNTYRYAAGMVRVSSDPCLMLRPLRIMCLSQARQRGRAVPGPTGYTASLVSAKQEN